EQGMESCTKNGDGTYKDDGSGSGTWTCQLNDVWWHQTLKLSDKRVEHMRAQVLNDATGWDDPTCQQVGCGAQAEAEPANDLQIYGNFTHDDTSLRDVHGGHSQRPGYARHYGLGLDGGQGGGRPAPRGRQGAGGGRGVERRGGRIRQDPAR